MHPLTDSQKEKSTGDTRKRATNWLTRKGGKENEKEQRKLCCIFCKGEHCRFETPVVV